METAKPKPKVRTTVEHAFHTISLLLGYSQVRAVVPRTYFD